MSTQYIPVSRSDLEDRGWEYLDFVMITGDAYVDHPSFGAAIIARLLESEGYRVGIISQPDWKSAEDFKRLGRPRLGFLITSGNMDSMVNHYTAAKKRRRSDDYTPGGKAGRRPDRATIVYASRAREAYKDVPIIIGGLEASLRRLVHYDYWDDDIRRSILIDAKSDYLLYGMAEEPVLKLAECLRSNSGESEIRKISGLCYRTKEIDHLHQYIIIPGYDDIKKDKRKFGTAFRKQAEENDSLFGKPIIQHQGSFHIVQNPPANPLTQEQLDNIYRLPYTRSGHPSYDRQGGVPALHEVQFSITTHRGCFGSCSFCAIHFHQGSTIQSRSEESIIHEAKILTSHPDFKGIIHDVGGPTANMYQLGCKRKDDPQFSCKRSCLFPEPCPNLNKDHAPSVRILEQLRQLPGVKKVFVRSGVRYDLMMKDTSQRYFSNLCTYHISGQLKVAPEHASKRVTDLMNKPKVQTFTDFVREFRHYNDSLQKQQYVIPYFIASHPGTTLEDAVELAEYMRDVGCFPEQVQDFTPTPGTLATAIYYTGYHPLTGEEVYVPKSEEERGLQRALMQYYLPRNHNQVRKALQLVKRSDLIGKDPKCLVPAEKISEQEKPSPKHRPQKRSKSRKGEK